MLVWLSGVGFRILPLALFFTLSDLVIYRSGRGDLLTKTLSGGSIVLRSSMTLVSMKKRMMRHSTFSAIIRTVGVSIIMGAGKVVEATGV